MDVSTKTEDFENNRPYYFYSICIAVSFLFWILIHHVVSPLYFYRRNDVYRELIREKRMEWDSRFMSTLHAVSVSALCIFALIFDRKLWSNPIAYPSDTGIIALTISVGYFLCDAVSMPMYWWNKDLLVFLVHHGAAVVAFSNIALHRCLVFFGVFRLLTEMSTPFANQRWFYRVMGYQPSCRRVAFVTLVFSILFALTRNIMALPYWIFVYKHFGSKEHDKMLTTFTMGSVIWMITPLILDALNVYWAIKVYQVGWRAYNCLRDAEWRSDIENLRLQMTLKRMHMHHFAESAAAHASDMGRRLASGSGELLRQQKQIAKQAKQAVVDHTLNIMRQTSLSTMTRTGPTKNNSDTKLQSTQDYQEKQYSDFEDSKKDSMVIRRRNGSTSNSRTYRKTLKNDSSSTTQKRSLSCTSTQVIPNDEYSITAEDIANATRYEEFYYDSRLSTPGSNTPIERSDSEEPFIQTKRMSKASNQNITLIDQWAPNDSRHVSQAETDIKFNSNDITKHNQIHTKENFNSVGLKEPFSSDQNDLGHQFRSSSSSSNKSTSQSARSSMCFEDKADSTPKASNTPIADDPRQRL